MDLTDLGTILMETLSPKEAKEAKALTEVRVRNI